MRVYPTSHHSTNEVLHSITAPTSITTSDGALMVTTQGTTRTTLNHGKKNKTLCFRDQVDIRFIITRHDISQQEHNDTWYSREEYKAISQACSKEISKMDRGEILKDKKYCARGLEVHTRIQTLSKSMNRSLAYQAVLEEQNRQNQEGTIHEVNLARVYCATSSSCQLWAHVVGLTDQREAQEFQNESEELSGWR